MNNTQDPIQQKYFKNSTTQQQGLAKLITGKKEKIIGLFNI